MRTLAVLALLALPALAAADEKPPLELELTAPKELYPDEAEAVVVKAAFRNSGKDDTHVVRAIDGSFDGLRSVVAYKWKVTKGGQVAPRRTDVVRIDNLVNALDGDDVLPVKAGKTADPEADGFGRFTDHYKLDVPGKYTITLTYELDPNGSEKLGAGGDQAIKIVRKLPAARIESKPLEVTVLAFPPAIAAAQDKVRLAQARHQIVVQFADTVEKNPNATKAERDAAAERVTRAAAVLKDAQDDYEAKMTEFRKKRDEERKKK